MSDAAPALGLSATTCATWVAAETEAGAVERNDPVMRCQHIDQPAPNKILRLSAVAVQQDRRIACAALDGVQVHAFGVDKPPAGRVALPSLTSRTPHLQSDADQYSLCRETDDNVGSTYLPSACDRC